MKFIKVETLNLQFNVKVVSLNRPEVKNAFHPEMISEITDFFQTEGQKADLILLKGEGTAFCAGADLGWMKSMVNFSQDENLEDGKKLWGMFDSIRICKAPVIGVVHGAVFGGALGLLASCDYVLGEENSQFCFSEVKLGLAPAMISDFIEAKIPDAFFRPLMISAEVFNTARAMQAGFVHRKFIGAITDEQVIQIFGPNGAEAMKATKKILNQLLHEKDISKRRDLCAETITERRMSAEGQGRLKKFLDKIK